MICTLIPPNQINKVWLKILPYVRDLVEISEGRVAELHLYEEIARGEQLLWVAMANDGSEAYGFITTKINEYSKLRMASLEYSGGAETEIWFLDLMDVIEKWAKQFNCDGLEMVCGRRGWTRKYKEAGFKDKFTWAEKRFLKEDNHGQGR